jgi:hypothetical protein
MEFKTNLDYFKTKFNFRIDSCTIKQTIFVSEVALSHFVLSAAELH